MTSNIKYIGMDVRYYAARTQSKVLRNDVTVEVDLGAGNFAGRTYRAVSARISLAKKIGVGVGGARTGIDDGGKIG